MQKRKLDIIQDFDSAAEIFAKWKPSERFEDIFRKSVVEILSSLRNNPKINILEVGCGHGTWLGFISQLKFSKKIYYVGIDFSNNRIQTAKKIFKKNKNAEFFAADYLGFPGSKKYDLVFFIEVFQYVDENNFKKFFEKAKNMLKKNGYAVIIDKDKYSAHSLKISLGNLFKKLPHYYRHVHYPSFSYLEKLAKSFGLKPIKRLKSKEFHALVLENKA